MPPIEFALRALNRVEDLHLSAGSLSVVKRLKACGAAIDVAPRDVADYLRRLACLDREAGQIQRAAITDLAAAKVEHLAAWKHSGSYAEVLA